MRLPIIPMILWIILNIGIGICIFNILRKRHAKLKIARYIWLTILAAITVLSIAIISTPYRSGDDAGLLRLNWMLFVVMTFTFPQIVYLIFDLLGRIPRLWGGRRCKW
ncbi:MAG: hypothetical protein K2L69_02750, partial [Muribaculaceae bacterium]|nr:hypothetical protein [Muribaculaceae bacterium]